MLVTMEQGCPGEAVQEVERWAEELGFRPRVLRGEQATAIVLIGEGDAEGARSLEFLPGVVKVSQLFSPFKLAGRESKPETTRFRVGAVDLGGAEIVLISGPCAVEGREAILEAAQAVKEAGAHLLRGGAYKPRTSPYSFQGLAEEGLEMLAEAGRRVGLPVVTEVVAPEDVPLVARYADMLQIGARNMQNFALLTAAGEAGRPVLLKRGPSSTIEEWLLAAEYVLLTGNDRVALCERGIRTFERYTRNTLDLAAVAAVKELSHLPVIVDPSHGTGKCRLVTPLAKAAVMAGADGLMIEVHPDPAKAQSDGYQSLTPEELRRLAGELPAVAAAAGRAFSAGTDVEAGGERA
ncbi:MAG: 3-deoxy-7-phosphoheptulonate synthase [Bacillota bacterium]|nr:3-deoxy-7-phosphoheptulonate synthase [Bacillota bacterium]